MSKLMEINVKVKDIAKAGVKPDVKIKEPPMYKVLILNDPVTPMDFVVDVLKKVFHKDSDAAFKLMKNAHTTGCSLCGIFPKDIAEMKMHLVKETAKKNKYPLCCVMDEE